MQQYSPPKKAMKHKGGARSQRQIHKSKLRRQTFRKAKQEIRNVNAEFA